MGRGAGLVTLLPLLLWACSGCVTERVASDSHFAWSGETTVRITAQAGVMRTWNGDYPVAGLGRLPADVRGSAVGYIADPETFASVWEAFRPGSGAPAVDFDTQLVLFARNVDFYNSLSIVRVSVEDGVAEPVVRETRSALPVTDVVAMSMVLVTRYGIIGVKTDGKVMDLPAPQPVL